MTTARQRVTKVRDAVLQMEQDSFGTGDVILKGAPHCVIGMLMVKDMASIKQNPLFAKGMSDYRAGRKSYGGVPITDEDFETEMWQDTLLSGVVYKMFEAEYDLEGCVLYDPNDENDGNREAILDALEANLRESDERLEE